MYKKGSPATAEELDLYRRLILSLHLASTDSPASIGGVVGVLRGDGTFVPAESAKVFVIYASAELNGSAAYDPDPDTAGGQFHTALKSLLEAAAKDLKRLEDDPTTSPGEKIARFNARLLQSDDDAMLKTSEWITAHPEQAWQLKSERGDTAGAWFVDQLPPGGYEIFARGKAGGLDVAWEASVDLGSGKNINVTLNQPRVTVLAK